MPNKKVKVTTKNTSKSKTFDEAISLGIFRSSDKIPLYHKYTESTIRAAIDLELERRKPKPEPKLISLGIEYLYKTKKTKEQLKASTNPNDSYYYDQYRNKMGESRYFEVGGDPNYVKEPAEGQTWRRPDITLAEISNNLEFASMPMEPGFVATTYVTSSGSFSDEIARFSRASDKGTVPRLIISITKHTIGDLSTLLFENRVVHRATPPKNSRFNTPRQLDTQGACGMEYLESQYNYSKSLARCFKPGKDNVYDMFNDIWVSQFGTEWDKKGVTPLMFIKFAERYDLSCHLLDGFSKPIINRISNRKSMYKAICGSFTSEHFYPVYDTDEIRRYNEQSTNFSAPSSILIDKHSMSQTSSKFWNTCEHVLITGSEYHPNCLKTIVSEFEIDDQLETLWLIEVLDLTAYVYMLSVEKHFNVNTVYIVDVQDFEKVCKYALDNNHVMNGNIKTTTFKHSVYPNNCQFVAVRPLIVDTDKYTPFSEYHMIMDWCKLNNITYSLKINIGFISKTVALENLDFPKAKFPGQLTLDEAALIVEGFTATAQQLLDLYMKHPQCSACGVVVYAVGTSKLCLRSKNGGSRIQDLQILCETDHAAISTRPLGIYRLEKGYYTGAISHYNNESLKHCVGTAEQPIKSKALTATPNLPSYLLNNRVNRIERKIKCSDNVHCYDLSKAHTRALYQGTPKYLGGGDDGLDAFNHVSFDWPEFTAYDEIKPHVGTFAKSQVILPGEYWVEFRDGRGPSTYDGYPILTNGKFNHPVIYWLVNFSGFSDFRITHSRIASGSKPANYYRKFIDNLTDQIPGGEKFAINHYIGSATKSFSRDVSIMDTTDRYEAVTAYLNNGYIRDNKISVKFSSDNTKYYNVMCVNRTLHQSSTISHYNQIIEQTVISTFELYRKMVNADGRILKHRTIDFKTDAVTIETFNEDLNVNIELSSPYYKREAFHLLTNVTAQNQIITVNNTSFKFDDVPFNLQKSGMDDIKKEVLTSYGYDTDDISPKNQIMIDQIVSSGVNFTKSILIDGMAGTGKTTLAGRIIKSLMATKKVKIMSYTNRVAELLRKTYGANAETIHTGLAIATGTCEMNKLGRDVEVLVVDECSMIPSDMLQLMLEIKRTYGVVFILLGCFNQSDSIEDAQLADIDERENSLLLRELCDFQKINLNKNIRSCDKLFTVFNKIVNNKDAPPHLIIDDLITSNAFNTSMNGIYRATCKFHKTRQRWNNYFNTKWIEAILPTLPNTATLPVVFNELVNKGTNKIRIKTSAILAHQIPVICRMNLHAMNLRNGMELKVWTWGNNTSGDGMFIQLVDENEETYILDLQFFLNTFSLGFVMTCYTDQGLTIDVPYVVLDINKMSFRDAYVAISRVTKIENLFFDISYKMDTAPTCPKIATPKPLPTQSLAQHLKTTQAQPLSAHQKLNNGSDSVSGIYQNLDGKVLVRDEHDMMTYIFDTPDTLEAAIMDYEHAALHEVVAPETIQRVYYDLDLSVPHYIASMSSIGETVTIETGLDLLDDLSKRLQKYTLEYLGSPDVVVQHSAMPNFNKEFTSEYYSNSEQKLSMHLMTPIYCINSAYARMVFKAVRLRVLHEFAHIPSTLLEQIIDGNMSRKWGSLRIIGSSKLSDPTRVKISEFEIPFHATLIGWYEPTLPDNLITDCPNLRQAPSEVVNTETQSEIKRIMNERTPGFWDSLEFRGDSYWCNRTKPSMCECCNRTHDSDSCIYFSVRDNINLCCTKSQKRVRIN